jgi:hypothetical protein
MKKLRDVEVPLANFFASGVIALREKLGPILWQLPPNLAWDEQRLSEFSSCCRVTRVKQQTLGKNTTINSKHAPGPGSASPAVFVTPSKFGTIVYDAGVLRAPAEA